MADEQATATVETTEAPVTPAAEPTPLTDLFSREEVKKSDVKASSPEITSEPEKAEGTPEDVNTEDDSPEGTAEKKDEPTEKPVSGEVAKIEARLKDTRDYATRVNQENAVLKQQLDQQNQYLTMINKKLDGTWSDADEQALNTPKGPTPEEAAHYGETQGKITASKSAAYNIYGKDVVDKTLLDPDGPFAQIMNDPIVKQKVLSADAPFIEAMEIVKVKQFYDKYGADPDKIHKNISAEVEAKLRDKITKEVMKQLTGKGNVPAGLRDVREAGSTSVTGGVTPLKELFAR